MKKLIAARMDAVKTLAIRPWFYPVFLFWVGLISYGVIFLQPGFYWDDWEGVYLYNLHLPMSGFFQYYAERPFSALAYLLLFPITKMTPWVWQWVALLLRWLGVLLIYYTLTNLWPRHIWHIRWFGVLLLVFPGYLSQPISVAFTQHLVTFVFFAASLLWMVMAIQNRKFFWLWMPLSILFGATHIFMMEYFVGLEIIRPLIIWFALHSREVDRKRILGKTLLYWLPFLIGLGFYLWWRLIYLPATLTTDPNDPVVLKTILTAPGLGLRLLAQKIHQDIGYLLTSVWATPFAFENLDVVSSKSVLAAWLVGITVAIFFVHLTWGAYREQSWKEDSFLSKMLLLGSLILFASPLPVWLTEKQIALGKWADRFTLAPMLGAIILVVCLLDWLVRTDRQKQWILAILLASSISLQIYNANKFRLDWLRQRDIYWQLHWRIPALEPGTALFGKGTFTDRSSYYDAIYIVNLLFADRARQDARYGYFDRHYTPMPEYVPGVRLSQTFRGIQFSGNTSQAIAFDFGSGGCVRVLDSIYREDRGVNTSVAKLFDISNVSNIRSAPERPLNPDIFGVEPPHNWCYYFEKADLARQMQDWDAILRLKAESDKQGLAPTLGGEYLPFIEAYAHTGQWKQAYQLSLKAQKIGTPPGLALCNAWRRFARLDTGHPDALEYTRKAIQQLCSVEKP